MVRIEQTAFGESGVGERTLLGLQHFKTILENGFVVELLENVRQRDDPEFGDFLKAVRDGTPLEPFLENLERCIMDNDTQLRNCRIVVETNQTRRIFNNLMTNKFATHNNKKITWIKCSDSKQGDGKLSRANKEALDRVADPELAIVEGLPAIFSEQVNKDLFMVKGALAYVKGIHLSANQSPVTDGQTNVFKLKQVNHLILVLDSPSSHLPNGIVVKPMKSYPSPRSQQRFLVSNFRFNRRLRSLFGRLRSNTRPSGDPF